jgi:hypothetical protein
MADDKQNRIRQRAHEIWEREGRPEGAHERHWQQAEGEIATEDGKGRRKSAASRKPAVKAGKPAAAKAAKAAPAAKAAARPKAAAKPKAAAAKKG